MSCISAIFRGMWGIISMFIFIPESISILILLMLMLLILFRLFISMLARGVSAAVFCCCPGGSDVACSADPAAMVGLQTGCVCENRAPIQRSDTVLFL